MREKHSPSVGPLLPLQSNLRGTRSLSPIEIIDAEHICRKTDMREGLLLSPGSRLEEPSAMQHSRLNLYLVQGGAIDLVARIRTAYGGMHNIANISSVLTSR